LEDETAYFRRGMPYARETDAAVIVRWTRTFQEFTRTYSHEALVVLADCCTELRRRAPQPRGAADEEFTAVLERAVNEHLSRRSC
jgi:uncharacterized membrane protein